MGLDENTEWKEELEGTQYDLRQSRLDILGRLVQEKTVVYLNLRKDPSLDQCKKYLDILATFYRNIKFYGQEESSDTQSTIESKVDSCEKRIRNLRRSDSVNDRVISDVRKELEDVDDLIDELRIEVGLDIPREKSKPEGMEMMR